MNCLRCELTRARLKAAALALVGWPLDRIAGHLSSCYGERYYVEGDRLYRASKLAPYEPHLIRGEQ
uniref:Uncharacterized protein n=1 Tax=Stenotrophomonas phage vB_SmaS_QH3 TaxID=3229738 RepID=A0AAU7YTG6_9CAUD